MLINSLNQSNIIKSGNNSNIYYFKNISLPNNNIIINNHPQPGDIVTCPNGNDVLVDELGNYYCDIDPNGNGLFPFTDVDCVNGANTTVNINGNIIGGCRPADGSFVTCLAGFTAPVENGTWSCAQGADDEEILFSSRNVIDIINSTPRTNLFFGNSRAIQIEGILPLEQVFDFTDNPSVLNLSKSVEKNGTISNLNVIFRFTKPVKFPEFSILRPIIYVSDENSSIFRYKFSSDIPLNINYNKANVINIDIPLDPINIDVTTNQKILLAYNFSSTNSIIPIITGICNIILRLS